MSQTFFVTENNPNEVTGGGGCLCSPVKGHDTKGPFVVFPATETESNLSPHAVVCADCICQAHDRLVGGEALVAGEIDSTADVVEDDLSL